MTKTILITGTSSGFGRATANLFADNGWNVIATMRDPAMAGDLDTHDNIFVTYLDVTDERSIKAAIEAGIARFGKIDAVVNNAGYGQYGVFEGISAEKIQKNFDVNLFGVMNVIRAIVPFFRNQNEGLILNVSSVGGLVGLPAISIYLATKFALEGFSESLSYEMASQNIVVKLVEPGGGDTAFHLRAAGDNTGDVGLTSYNDFLARSVAAMSQLGQRMSTPEAISQAIFGAVTDGTRRLRYFAGPDVKHLVDARRALTDEAYEVYMREQFA